MHEHNDSALRHAHTFTATENRFARKTWIVLAITLMMMVAEIVAGWLTGSIALLADGWHMGTHAFALGVSVFAYWLSAKHQQDSRYSLGSWRIEILGAYTSAIILGAVALAVAWESVSRFLAPTPIAFREALIVAVIGLFVNSICAVLLHSHDGHSHDLNARSAYLHVLADALTSVLAIVALALGWWLGWSWADAAVGLLGAVLILRWAKSLLADSARILLDREMDSPIASEVRAALESDGDTKITDLHLSRVGPNVYSAQIAIVADSPFSPEHYRSRLTKIPALAHVTVECNRCKGSRREALV
jgi:cation diffusion facilitator family transporter